MNLMAKLWRSANPPEPDPVEQIYLARQPILDRLGEVYAYELLYRGSKTNAANVFDADYATTKLITNTFLEFGLHSISNGKPVFINLPRSFITGAMPIPLPPGEVVLEILEDISADQEALDGVKRLVEEGFTLALDDFITSDQNQAFIPLARIIKIDILAMNETELRAEVARLQDFPSDLLAEKVETREQYELCMELGFHYFQGYFFSKPALIEGKQLPTSQIALIKMLAKLQDPECRIEDIEKIISNDIGMSYKLFKSINSSYYGVGKTVDSIQHALILLGLNTLKKWLTLITLTTTEKKPRELITLALVRARMCELLAQDLQLKTESAFTVGMFSLLDAIMDQPLDRLLLNLPLAPDISDALLHGKGGLGSLLTTVIAYETGDWEAVAENSRLSNVDLLKKYQQALEWSDSLLA